MTMGSSVMQYPVFAVMYLLTEKTVAPPECDLAQQELLYWHGLKNCGFLLRCLLGLVGGGRILQN